MNYICNICRSKTRKLYDSRLQADYYCCQVCEFISKDDQATISSDEALRIYNYHNNSIKDPMYVAYFYEFLNDAVFQYTNEEKKGLDFGSGPSPVLAQILERHGYAMDTYDLFYAPNKVYLNKKYDLITSTEVVEHLKNPLEYFELFKEHLVDTGILSIMTLFHEKNDEHFLNWHYKRDKSHISFYTLKTMEFIAESVGLRIIHSNGSRYTTFALDNGGINMTKMIRKNKTD